MSPFEKIRCTTGMYGITQDHKTRILHEYCLNALAQTLQRPAPGKALMLWPQN